MADIQPFRAFRYDPRRVSPDLVVTQPYDKITRELQDRYYAASPYNLVRIILGRRDAGDNREDNVYTRAAFSLKKWRAEGVLRQDEQPSIYAYSQRFKAPGSNNELERRGFIALGRIEDYSAGVVFRHEQTLAKPKADRLDLLRATRAHFGQIFVLYEDSGQIDAMIEISTAPEVSVTDEYGVIHSVWQIVDPAVIDTVRTAMRDKKLIIADGHHRYETALNYRNECRERNKQDSSSTRSTSSDAPSSNSPSSDAASEFVMMTFVNMNSPALVILPTHRVVHSLTSFSDDAFRAAARPFFDIDEVELPLDAARATTMLRECGRCGSCILAVTPRRAFLLHHPNPNATQVFDGLSVRQQSLDVVQLHKYLLENVLGLSEESIRNQQNLSYVRDAGEALSQVQDEARANIVFLMNPCRAAQVRDVAFAGEVMPQKSTDFYPKLLSGLTVYALD